MEFLCFKDSRRAKLVYVKSLIKDIDDGLALWPQLSQNIAQFSTKEYILQISFRWAVFAIIESVSEVSS